MSADLPHFTGSIPENYDRYLVPILFRPFAESLAARVAGLKPFGVLEMACGTGAVTQALAAELPGKARIVATDVSQSMLEFGRQKVDRSESIEWEVADACSLPFDDGSFDVIACQFGAMFFPDKPAAMAEAFRVLSPGGHLIFSTWGEITVNPVFHCVEDTLSVMLPEEERPIMPTPFLMSNPAEVRNLVLGAGFGSVEIVDESHSAGPCDPASLASGFAYGTPLGLYLSGRGYDIGNIYSALAAGFVAALGDPAVFAMQAIVCIATKM